MVNMNEIPYSFERFEQDLQKVKPRFFDTYILAPFMLWFAYSSKTAMGRWPRRILFTAGTYMLYRNYVEYKKAATLLYNKILQVPQTTEQGIENA